MNNVVVKALHSPTSPGCLVGYVCSC